MSKTAVAQRFRGFLPVVVDVETGGFNAATDALLEIAAVLLGWDEIRGWHRVETLARHVKPFEGARMEESALKFNKINPWHPFRLAVDEREALSDIFKRIRDAIDLHGCSRAVMVGHNPAFDLAFLRAAVERTRLKRNPFHAFSTFDTASLAGVAFGQTVLSRAVTAAQLEWSEEAAHSAIYDAEKTADLFCVIVNQWDLYRGSEPPNA